jgi:RNA polymerase sigma-70 factor (ECF subfamily)
VFLVPFGEVVPKRTELTMAQALTETQLREWMNKLGPRLLNLATGICRDRHRAEEIVQEAFVKLWNNPPDSGPVVYPSWLRRVVTNLSINALQRTRRPGALPEVTDDRSLCAEDETGHLADVREDCKNVRAAMEKLDEAKRAILYLRAYEQLSYEQIAEHLGVPVGTVMSRLNRARAALIEQLREDAGAAEDEPMVYDFRKYKQA